ncbi:MAG: hypothetical protein CMJ23_06235 [Phycisphaerae bacterium]|nr:hypothetical protein [Phycisphaerae bacterium]
MSDHHKSDFRPETSESSGIGGPDGQDLEPIRCAEQVHQPSRGEAQLTLRAVLTGCALGCVVASMNIYFGLKTGWSIGGSLIAAILGFSIWKILAPIGARQLSVLETNIAQTSGSAAGSMTSAAGMLSAIPALGLMGVEFSYFQLAGWALAVGFLGVFYAVPLRNQMVVVEKLRFPTGTATAETIVSMNSAGGAGDALRQARMLLLWALVAAVFTQVKYFYPIIEHPMFANLIAGPDVTAAIKGGEAVEAAGWVVLYVTAGAWGFSLLFSPLMFGAGILIGPRVGTSLLLGSILGWAILGPWSKSAGWAEGPIMSYADGPRGWLLWPGVAIMIADAFANLALSWRTILNTFRPGRSDLEDGEMLEPPSMLIPNLWWMGGLGTASIITMVVAHSVFGIPWWMTLLAVAMSSVLAMIATRSTGETDINPIGGMGKVTQLAFGAVAPGQADVNVLAASITSAGASQSGDMMQDLKTGRLLGASPRKQILAQLAGITCGIPICAAVYKLFDSQYEIGVDESFPAPAANAWKAMAELLSGGFDQLPTHAGWAIAGGALFGVLLPVLRKTVKPIAPFVPSSLAMGIAFLVPAYYSVAMFLGSMILVFWRKLSPASAAALAIAVASGLIAGEGLTGVLAAIESLIGMPEGEGIGAAWQWITGSSPDS